MRRRLSLYIDGQLADLDDQSFVLFNYAASNFDNPAAVLNGYSQSVTLPGTERNNRIFGHAFRVDRRAYIAETQRSGIYFVPSLRTPFAIYDELGEVLGSGYLKLDEVKRTGRGPASYQVTLFGGLGSFLFGLSYNAQGERLSLADLDYLGTEDPASELDFTIDASVVNNAWRYLYTHATPGSRSSMWGVVNFAPCYNGCPDQGFSSDRGIFSPSAANLPGTSGVFDVEYTGGYALATLPRKFDEWEVKDLRSYLQRPVVSVQKVLEAICNPDNNGGWTVTMPDLSAADFAFDDLWLTLPLLPHLGTYKKTSGGGTVTLSPTTYASGTLMGTASVTFTDTLPAGATVSVGLSVRPSFGFPTTGSLSMANTKPAEPGQQFNETYISVLFVQAVGYSSGVAVGSSPVQLLGNPSSNWNSVALAAAACGYTPVHGGSDKLEQGTIRRNYNFSYNSSAGRYIGIRDLSFSVEGPNINSVRLFVSCYTYTIFTTSDGLGGGETDPEATAMPTLRDSNYTPVAASSLGITAGTGDNTASFVTSATLRSGAVVTKRMLLNTAFTPADFLLSFCKTFGLAILCDAAAKTVQVVSRNSLYDGEVIDLTGRVDTLQPIALEPCAFSARWYEFSHASVGGEFAAQYAAVQGREYGAQLVNTGYDFDASTTKVLEGGCLLSAVPVLERSSCFYSFHSSTFYYPTPFIFAGCKYTLWNAAMQTKELEISALSSTIVGAAAPLNGSRPGYDVPYHWKAQFHDGDRKPLDGAGVLLQLDYFRNYPGFHLSDDSVEMDVMNGGPCWLLDYDSNAILVPLFSRYKAAEATPSTVVASLDFGQPSELDIPDIIYPEDTTLYRRRWGAWIGDRLDASTKVLRCMVDLRGLQVGPELLRHFYYLGGSLWVLNKINNHSLTTWDLTDCEMVQVQDEGNYTNGQF